MGNFSTLRLIVDGCGGQNKNTTLITMLMKWFFSINKHIESVEIIFPIVGHSFIPPDRVFAQIEKKKKEAIVQPEDISSLILQKDFSCDIPRTVNKKGSGTPNSSKPSTVTGGKQINDKKLKSIDELLKKHYGTTKPWKDLEQLNFYKNLIQNFDENNLKEPIPEDDLPCEYAEEIYLAV
ncbi:unnamed protein product [Psylliodes chrysocephalus]|uniref:Uncharacterized protein n=1 Tax=Psylliodes chrysocephalus TaxID=3402493 RepID=A0A9P0CLR6_9CUCU|nr:unnamed protein product [Psylliodes chrysocephala]